MSVDKAASIPPVRNGRSHIKAVKQSADRASEELDFEQKESVKGLAEVLIEISAEESLAHLESRIAFLERQIDRLTERRDEVEGVLETELSMMKARIEDALQAVGSVLEEQREVRASIEASLGERFERSNERHAAEIASLRKDMAELVAEATARFVETEAHIKGEIKAFEDSSSERSRISSEVLEAGQEVTSGLSAQFEEMEERLRTSLEGEKSAQRKTLSALATSLESRVSSQGEALRSAMNQFRSGVEQGLSKEREEVQTMLKSVRAINASFEEMSSKMALAEAQRAGGTAALGISLDGLAARLAELETRVQNSVESSSMDLANKVQLIEARLDQLLVAKTAATEEKGEFAYVSRSLGEVAERLEAVERKVALNRTILPEAKRKLRW